MRNYIDLKTIYQQENYFGDFKIFSNTELVNASQIIRDFYISDGSFAKNEQMALIRMSTNEALMTDNEFELLTNKEFLDNANGDILIIGLGFGLIVFPLLNDENITSITIVEKEQDIIEFVGNKIKETDFNNKVTIINDNANSFYNSTNIQTYDYIYIDYWTELQIEQFNEMELMNILYSPFLKNSSSKIKCWCDDIKHLLIN
jgi:spermidine synthase